MRRHLVCTIASLFAASTAFGDGIQVKVGTTLVLPAAGDPPIGNDQVVVLRLDGDPDQAGFQPITGSVHVSVYDSRSGAIPTLSVRRFVLQGSVQGTGRVDLSFLRQDGFPTDPAQVFQNNIGLRYLGARPAGYYDELDPGDPVEPLGDPDNPHAGKILVFENPDDPSDTSLRDHTRLAIGVLEAIHGNNSLATIRVGQVFRIQAANPFDSSKGDITARIETTKSDDAVTFGQDSIGYIVAGNLISGNIKSAGSISRIAVSPSPSALGIVPSGIGPSGEANIQAEGSIEQV